MNPDTPIAYRYAEPDDCDLVVKLLGELVREIGPESVSERVTPLLPEDIEKALVSNRCCVVLAESKGKALGFARADILTEDPIFRLREDHRCGYIDQMYVRLEHRNDGLGAKLLQRCEAWFKTQGVRHVLLHAAPRAVRFYARMGYQPNREMFKDLEPASRG